MLAVGEKCGLKLGKAQAPVRVAVTSRTIDLPLFESMELLGRDRGLARLDAAAKKLAAAQAQPSPVRRPPREARPRRLHLLAAPRAKWA